MMLHTKYQLRDRRGCQGHTVNKLGRGQLGNVTKQGSRGLMFSDKMFYCAHYISLL